MVVDGCSGHPEQEPSIALARRATVQTRPRKLDGHVVCRAVGDESCESNTALGGAETHVLVVDVHLWRVWASDLEQLIIPEVSAGLGGWAFAVIIYENGEGWSPRSGLCKNVRRWGNC